MNHHQFVSCVGLNKALSSFGFTGLPHLNIGLTELYDREGFPHHLPVTFVIDGANFGTITL